MSSWSFGIYTVYKKYGDSKKWRLNQGKIASIIANALIILLPIEKSEVVTILLCWRLISSYHYLLWKTDNFSSMPYPSIESDTFSVADGSPIHSTAWSVLLPYIYYIYSKNILKIHIYLSNELSIHNFARCNIITIPYLKNFINRYQNNTRTSKNILILV